MSMPVLYVLMRTDMESMNPGKAMAQSHHCGSAFHKHGADRLSTGTIDEADLDLHNAFETWKGETPQGFGTVLVLGVTESQMNTAITIAQSVDMVAGVVNDPTYPLRDGDSVHFFPVDTCGYLFAPDKDDPLLRAIVGNFKLHP